ncbi:MAG: hypothetical protein ACKPKE_07600 [Microcystis panniformis]
MAPTAPAIDFGERTMQIDCSAIAALVGCVPYSGSYCSSDRFWGTHHAD